MTITSSVQTTRALQFQAPKEFSGKPEDFDEFAFELKAHLNLIDSRFNEVLEDIQEHLDIERDDLQFKDDRGHVMNELIHMSAHLQWLLEHICTGSASTFLSSMRARSGFESFRRLCIQYSSSARTTSVERLTRILNPSLNLRKFEESVSEWENDILNYEQATRSNTLRDDVKVAILMGRARGQNYWSILQN